MTQPGYLRLDPDAVAQRAEKLWVVPPGGSLL